jgi:hypothetical protein
MTCPRKWSRRELSHVKNGTVKALGGGDVLADQLDEQSEARGTGGGTVSKFRARLGRLTDQSMVVVKRSPKRTVDCDLAVDHVRGGMIHCFS